MSSEIEGLFFSMALRSREATANSLSDVLLPLTSFDKKTYRE